MTKEILEYKIGQTESVINQAKQNPDKDVYNRIGTKRR